MRVELEYTVMVRRTAWRCALPCNRTVRHRDERKGLLPALCPVCSGPMKLYDTYTVPRNETHTFAMGRIDDESCYLR
jgi:hypothetical protein